MEPTDYPLPDPIVTVSPDWLGGEPCFTGRRVAVKALFDYLKADHTLEAFLADFPSVSRAHAVAVIDLATRAEALLHSAWQSGRNGPAPVGASVDWIVTTNATPPHPALRATFSPWEKERCD
jgi:uncharacterized protein (DUF433 family)